MNASVSPKAREPWGEKTAQNKMRTPAQFDLVSKRTKPRSIKSATNQPITNPTAVLIPKQRPAVSSMMKKLARSL